jgi:signal transduction histidine kinase
VNFEHVQPGFRVVFGAGSFERLADELEPRRWLIVHGGSQAAAAEQLAGRIGADRFGEVRRHVPVELAERARERFADRTARHGRELRVDAPAGLEARLDPLRMRQALGNLVDNALRHGEGTVTLAGRAADGAVEVEVRDEGPGFPAELAERAFERFARGGTGRAGGSGLGLAIVRAIADAHGGSAELARGEPGAVVRIRVPLSSASQPR